MPDFPERRKSDAFIHARIDGIDARLKSVEGWAENFEIKMVDVGIEVKANTRLTEEIHGNTMELVELGRWVKTSRRYAISACGVVIAVGGVLKLFGVV